MNVLTALFLAVLDVTWRASCLIVLVYALRPLLRGRLPARLIFAAWIAVAVRLLLPVGLPSAWSPFNLTALWGTAEPAAPRHLPLLTSSLPGPATSATASASLPSVVSTSAWSRLAAISPVSWLALVWAAGVLVLATARTIAWVRFTRRLRRDRAAQADVVRDSAPDVPVEANRGSFASLEVDGDLRAPSGGRTRASRRPSRLLKTALGDRRPPTDTSQIEFIVTEAVRAPAVQGIFRPRLLIPQSFLDGLTAEEFRHTVAHELTHARRRDLLVQALLHAAAILHWFNPLAWLVVRTARHDCELACDESVLRHLPETEHAAYGATLMKIVSLAHGGLTAPRFGLGVVETKQHLKRRIEMIIAQPTSTPARTLLGAALLVSIALLSLTRELPAQSPAVGPAPAASASAGIQRMEAPRASTLASPAPPVTLGSATFGQPVAVDRLATLYPTGTIATIGTRTITVDEVRRELIPLLPGLRSSTTDPEKYEQKLIRLQDSVIKDLIDRAMVIQEFHRVPASGQARHIAEETIDREIADMVSSQFDNDREKFLAYLKAQNLTVRDFRNQMEDQLAYRYMKGQERTVAAAEKAVADKAAAAEAARKSDPRGSVHLRMIQLTRASGETDHGLRLRAKVVLDRFQAGEKFEALAREFSQDSRNKRGGDWGWLYPSDIKAVFSDPIFAMKAGEISAPIILPEGGFLFYVEEKK